MLGPALLLLVALRQAPGASAFGAASRRHLLTAAAPARKAPAARAANAVVVLGQSLNADGSPAGTLVSRTEAALVAYKGLQDADVVVTGADPAQVGVTEASVMQGMLVQDGVPSARIHLEDHAMNTVQNALYTSAILRDMGAQRVTLVTSDFHMPRASYTFEAVFAMPANAGRFTLALRPAAGGCPTAAAPAGADINEQSLVQRLQGEEQIVQSQLQLAELPADLAGAHVPSPGTARIQQALDEVRAMLKAAEAR